MPHQATDLEARSRLYARAVAAFSLVREILTETSPADLRGAGRVLGDLEEDSVSQSSALAWEAWLGLAAETAGLVPPDDLSFVRGTCGGQLHHWIEVKGLDETWIIDVAPADVYSGPILVGPRSPLRLLYGGEG